MANCISSLPWTGGSFEGGVAAEYQSVMSIGPNKVMNGNCEPPSGRTSIRSSHAVAFPPLYPIPSAPVPFSIRHESSLSSILNRLIGFYREPPGQRALGNHPLVRLNDRAAFEPTCSYSESCRPSLVYYFFDFFLLDSTLYSVGNSLKYRLRQ